MKRLDKTYYCDFCGKSQHEVGSIVPGPLDVAICNECVFHCVLVMMKTRPEDISKSVNQPSTEVKGA